MGFSNFSSGIRSVCYDCQDRYPACHDTCEKYLDAKNEYQNRKQVIESARNEYKQYDLYKLETVRKARKGRNASKVYSKSNNSHKR